MKKVLIVGGGIGGKVNAKIRNGAKFDLTASILMTPEIYTEIFDSVGKNYRDYFELVKIDPIYNVNYRNGVSVIIEGSKILSKLICDKYYNYKI